MFWFLCEGEFFLVLIFYEGDNVIFNKKEYDFFIKGFIFCKHIPLFE